MKASDFYNNGIFKDYYLTLQIHRNAESEVISFAYKALAKKNHPDMGGKAEKMKLINEAFEILKNPATKSEYDKVYDMEKRAVESREENTKIHYENTTVKEHQKEKENHRSQVNSQNSEKSTYEVHEVINKNQNIINDLRNKIAVQNLSDNAYAVTVKNINFIIPRACVCCLEEPDSQVKIRYLFDENSVFYNRYKALALSFPICHACKKHIREFTIKRILFIILSLLPGTMVSLWLIHKMSGITWTTLSIIGLVNTLLFIFLFSVLIKMSSISDQHASRGASVGVLNCDEWGIRLWFYNWWYAEQFAKENGSRAIPFTEKKFGRDRSLLKGGLALQSFIVISLLMIAIISIIMICFNHIEVL